MFVASFVALPILATSTTPMPLFAIFVVCCIPRGERERELITFTYANYSRPAPVSCCRLSLSLSLSPTRIFDLTLRGYSLARHRLRQITPRDFVVLNSTKHTRSG